MLTIAEPVGLEVWRVGRRLDPWEWVGWEWATDGRFGGRWDDRDGSFRTPHVESLANVALSPDHPDVITALEMLGLRWRGR
ncbi:hypothetical protein GCM10027062_44930 [Nocardioides hungaricus]